MCNISMRTDSIVGISSILKILKVPGFPCYVLPNDYVSELGIEPYRV